jgi:hypothetical protein
MFSSGRLKRPGSDNRVEILGFQTCPPDERAANFRHHEEVVSVRCIFQFPAINGRMWSDATIGLGLKNASTLEANSRHDHNGCGSAFLARGLKVHSDRNEGSP